MEQELTTRAPRRGRPTAAEIAARPAPQPIEHVPVVVQQIGVRCVGCGRAVLPRALQTSAVHRKLGCPICGCVMVERNGMIQRI